MAPKILPITIIVGSFAIHSGFAATYTPGTADTPAGSGNYVQSVWAGPVFSDGVVPSGTTWGTLRGNATEPAAPVTVEIPDGRFYTADPLLAIAPGWGGRFSIESTLTAGYVGDNTSYYRYLSSASFPGSDTATVIGSISNYSSLTFFGSGDSTHTFDFSQMELGYLPSGTMIVVNDLEAYGSATTYEGPLSITSNVAGEFLDWTYGGNLINDTLIRQPIVSWDSTTSTWTINPGTLSPNAAAINNSSDTNVFVTTQNLTSLTVTSRVAIQNPTASHSFFVYAPTVPVPEPSVGLLLGTVSLIGLVRRR